jgi:heme O synthase-like polyprenyltransferase
LIGAEGNLLYNDKKGGRFDQGPMHIVLLFPIFYTIFQMVPKFPTKLEMREDSTHGVILIAYSLFGSLFIFFQGFVSNEVIVGSIVGLILLSFGANYYVNRETNHFEFSNIIICVLLFLAGIIAWVMDQIEGKPKF